MTDQPVITTKVARLSAALAEVQIHADFKGKAPVDGHLAGKITGPRCSGSETIEIAYAVQSVRPDKRFPHRISARVIIPEPNLWEADTPFTYGGTVEVWDGQAKSFETMVEFGLRTPPQN